VAGIVDQFIKGAVGSLAKDKITNTLTPTQMELASFILNPQYYIAEKGINKIADILGYGSDYKNLSADAKSDKDYYKEIIRDSIGNVLPSSIGDIVRATPRTSEADLQPAGAYTTFDPATQTYIQQESSNPVTSANSFGFENFVRDLNYGTQTPGTGAAVGPLPEGNPIFQSNVSNLPYELQSTPVSGAPEGFDPALLAAIIRDANTTSTGATDDLGEGTIVDQNSSGGGGTLSYTDMIDILSSTPNVGGSRGLNVPGAESLAPVGSVYDSSIGANTPAIDSLAPAGYTFDVNTGTVVPATDTSNVSPAGYTFDAGSGMNVPEAAAPEGYTFDANTGMNEYLGGGYGGGGKYYDDFSSAAYVKGGQIYRGRR
jgi:hypothetical protein